MDLIAYGTSDARDVTRWRIYQISTSGLGPVVLLYLHYYHIDNAICIFPG